jgi:ElaB/YqjD/DUF883 family membrane-anchored ribosome-binding protein
LDAARSNLAPQQEWEFDQLNSDGDRNDAKAQADSKTDKAAGAAQDAYGKAKDAASEVADKATSAAEGVGATLQDAARKVAGQASDVGEQVYKQAADAGRYAGQQVQEQPLAALLVAGCIGAAIGYLIGRESRPKRRTIRDYAKDAIPRRLR